MVFPAGGTVTDTCRQEGVSFLLPSAFPSCCRNPGGGRHPMTPVKANPSSAPDATVTQVAGGSDYSSLTPSPHKSLQAVLCRTHGCVSSDPSWEGGSFHQGHSYGLPSGTVRNCPNVTRWQPHLTILQSRVVRICALSSGEEEGFHGRFPFSCNQFCRRRRQI